MNSLIGKFVTHLLSKYIKNLNSSENSFNIFNKGICLKNVELNPDIFENLGSSKIKLEYSNIEELSIKIPLSAIFTKGIEIEINNIQICIMGKQGCFSPNKYNCDEKNKVPKNNQSDLDTEWQMKKATLKKFEENIMDENGQAENLLKKMNTF